MTGRHIDSLRHFGLNSLIHLVFDMKLVLAAIYNDKMITVDVLLTFDDLLGGGAIF